MPRRCTICTHKECSSINRALASRQPHRELAGRYGVSRSAMGRHAREHIASLLLAKARDEEEMRLAVEQTVRGLLAALRIFFSRNERLEVAGEKNEPKPTDERRQA